MTKNSAEGIKITSDSISALTQTLLTLTLKECFIKWPKYQGLSYTQIYIVREEVSIEFGALNPLGQWDNKVPPTIYTNFKFSIHIN